MKSHDMTAKSDCAARSGGAFVADTMLRVAMRRNPGAVISAPYVRD
jgi:hypothetical protein